MRSLPGSWPSARRRRRRRRRGRREKTRPKLATARPAAADALKRQGIKWRDGGTVYEAIHGKVSDNASNMAKGWVGFAGGFCADHTIELSVKAFTGAQGVKDTFSRAKGIVGYFHRSTAGIQDLTIIQTAASLPQKQPIQDVATRWFSSYGMVDWFREQQHAVQMYDVKHGTEASKNDAYKANRLQHVRTNRSN